MPRKPAILLMILLIAGGGVAFYFHLRQQTRPEFSELNRLLLHELPSSEWLGINGGEYPGEIFEGPSWFDHLGIDRSKDAMITQYIVTIPQDKHYWIHLDVIHDDERIVKMVMTPISTTDHDEAFRRMILERYPRLEPIFKLRKGVP